MTATLGAFALNQQSQPILEWQGRDVRRGVLVFEGVRHAAQAQRVEFLDQGVMQHRAISL